MRFADPLPTELETNHALFGTPSHLLERVTDVSADRPSDEAWGADTQSRSIAFLPISLMMASTSENRVELTIWTEIQVPFA